jgi:SpoVK/Ycf46/Vps4 family AAA+-type ATPase
MPKLLPQFKEKTNEEPYHSNLEHLTAELHRLDLLIQIQLVREKQRYQTNPLDQFKGLVISESEISELLTDGSDSNPDNIKSQTLINRLTHLETQMNRRREISLAQGIYLSLPHLVSMFNLTPFEEQVVVICLAPELDRKYEKLYAYLQDDITRKKPSVDLTLTLLIKNREEKVAARLAFQSQSPLSKFLLRFTDSDLEGTTPLISRFLKLDDRIVDFLLGFNNPDHQLENMVKLVSDLEPELNLNLPKELEQIRGAAQAICEQRVATKQKMIFYCYGPYGAGKKLFAKLISHDLGLPFLIVDLQKMLNCQISHQELFRLLGREAVLQQAVLCFDNFQALLDEPEKYQADLKYFQDMIDTFSVLTFILGSKPWSLPGFLNEYLFLEVEFKIPPANDRQKLWADFAGEYQLNTGIDWGYLATKFRFTPGQIKDALATARNYTTGNPAGDGRISLANLYTACHRQSNRKLGALARKLKPQYTWDEIVLPMEQITQMTDICNQVKYRQLVFGEWGFDQKLSLGKGLNILFSGPPGTGKTMAADVIARDLHLELYKIDLSQVVSKYIGETEKNLAKVFEEAETSNAILFFDEADALFGKRSEVKDAHDRYANIEIGYLLQRMEEYEGIVILATNLNKNMDEAFLRRMHFVVEFPFPGVEQRDQMWRQIFPENAPVAEDIDYQFLAGRLKITGGNIKNIALASAFQAANETGVIGMKHILFAARREYQKIGKAFFKSDLEPYAKLLEAESDVVI